MLGSVVTKKTNWEIWTMNLVLKNNLTWRMKNFDTFGVHEKIRVLGVHEKPI